MSELPTPEELVAQAKVRRLSIECWAAAAKKSGNERLIRYIELIEQNRDSVVGAQVSEQLEDHFGIVKDVDTIRVHLRGRCSCRRMKTTKI